MGGNAFADTVRLTPSEHARVRRLVMSALQQNPHLSETLRVLSSAEILDKPTFGDVDLYASCRSPAAGPDRVRDAMTEFLARALRSPEKPVRNGRTVSFLTPERYQVDVGFVEDAAQLAMYATVHSNGDFARLLQVSLSRRGLGLTTEGLFLRRERQETMSKREASFLLSVDPVKVGEFLGLPPDAFDGHTSLSHSRAFDLIVHNRFFDASAMTAWCESGSPSATATSSGGSTTSSKRRPMIVSFCDWWHSTGKSSFNESSFHPCDCGDEDGWVEFFGARTRYREWQGKGTEKEKEVHMRKECKRWLNFGKIQSWFPEFPNALVGEVLRKMRGRVEGGVVEFHGWLRSMGEEELREEVRGVAREIEQSFRWRCARDGVSSRV